VTAAAAGHTGVTVGLPAETKDRERRVALTPSAVHMAVDLGHRVLVQAGAGIGAGFPDEATPRRARRSSPDPRRSGAPTSS
jgi:hypothetical protein